MPLRPSLPGPLMPTSGRLNELKKLACWSQTTPNVTISPPLMLGGLPRSVQVLATWDQLLCSGIVHRVVALFVGSFDYYWKLASLLLAVDH